MIHIMLYVGHVYTCTSLFSHLYCFFITCATCVRVECSLYLVFNIVCASYKAKDQEKNSYALSNEHCAQQYGNGKLAES